MGPVCFYASRAEMHQHLSDQSAGQRERTKPDIDKPQKRPHFHVKMYTTTLQLYNPLSRNLEKFCLHKLCNNSILQKSKEMRTVSMTGAGS
jgi:hypothetical protein